jgi:hypothetical protein
LLSAPLSGTLKLPGNARPPGVSNWSDQYTNA